MNLQNLLNCFSEIEKKQLFEILLTDLKIEKTEYKVGLKIIDWVNSQKNISIRLENCLLQKTYTSNNFLNGDFPIFIDEILDRVSFMRIRGAGKKTYDEFKRLLNWC